MCRTAQPLLFDFEATVTDFPIPSGHQNSCQIFGRSTEIYPFSVSMRHSAERAKNLKVATAKSSKNVDGDATEEAALRDRELCIFVVCVMQCVMARF